MGCEDEDSAGQMIAEMTAYAQSLDATVTHVEGPRLTLMQPLAGEQCDNDSR